jgi:Ca2+-binding RTX toxin-like protein
VANLDIDFFGGGDAEGDFAVSVENLVGSALSDALTGNNAVNRLTGLGGDDFLNGGGGADILVGGFGDDSYTIDSAGDVVVELAGEGGDRIASFITVTLGANVEELQLMGSGNLDGTGNGLVNALTGNNGNNTLDGKAGADIMEGLGGNDTYVVDDAGDEVFEAAGLGVDMVRSSVSFLLGANVENLVLTGNADIAGIGNVEANTIVGNAGDNTIIGGLADDVVRGGKGNDVYVVIDAGDVVVEQAGEGIDRVETDISFTLAANVENLLLVGSATNGTGNALANTLTGNGLANVLDGKAGADTMVGGDGGDVYVVDDAGDVVTELANQGSDAIWSVISRSLAANVETLLLLGSANIDGTGNALANTIFGNGGDNVLDGGGGGDILRGGVGNDAYIADAADVVEEFAGQGIDTVRTAVSRASLEVNVENLVLTGGGNISGIGNALDNLLIGNAGNNALHGQAGSDTMKGGAGNDFYAVDDAGDVVVENAGQGVDLVHSSVSEILAANVENLVLLDGSNPDNPLNINGIGNALANTLTGNAGNNLLDGKAGADTMRGGSGDDTYRVDHTGDTIVESAGSGEDAVEASVSFTLANNVEDLTLTGIADINATGNSLGNVLLGNSGDNILDGKAHGDFMAGGDGDDTYFVDHLGDEIAEGAGKGTDRVQASASHVLSNNVEHLTLTGNSGIAGTGNALANTITGNGGSNVIAGKGGHDTLRGNGGADFFLFDTPPSIAANLDTVADFSAAADTIRLDRSVFAALGLGQLDADAFIKAAAAADAEDRIIFNAANGLLSYDRDGTGAAAAVAFARLSGNQSALSHTDFVVVA